MATTPKPPVVATESELLDPVPNEAETAAAPGAVPDAAPPAAGGRYTRDPVTAELTLITPSTIQE